MRKNWVLRSVFCFLSKKILTKRPLKFQNLRPLVNYNHWLSVALLAVSTSTSTSTCSRREYSILTHINLFTLFNSLPLGMLKPTFLGKPWEAGVGPQEETAFICSFVHLFAHSSIRPFVYADFISWLPQAQLY